METITVADIADEKTEVAPPGMPLALLELLRLVAAKDADHARLELQEPLDQSRADGSGSSSHKDPLSG